MTFLNYNTNPVINSVQGKYLIIEHGGKAMPIYLMSTRQQKKNCHIFHEERGLESASSASPVLFFYLMAWKLHHSSFKCFDLRVVCALHVSKKFGS
jgi:hypothetical protein